MARIEGATKMTFIDKPLTTDDWYYNMNMNDCPVGRKVIVLNHGDVA